LNAPSRPDEVIKLAYEEACTALRAQDATLDKVRNRTTGLLAAARLLEAAGEDIDLVRRVTTQAMIAALASNDRVLGRQMAVYRLVVGLTLVLVVLFVALILSRV
jgi:hypothetical protein